jgi:hypothetical protein
MVSVNEAAAVGRPCPPHCEHPEDGDLSRLELPQPVSPPASPEPTAGTDCLYSTNHRVAPQPKQNAIAAAKDGSPPARSI